MGQKFKDQLLEDLVRSYHKAKKGKRKSRSEHAFEVYSLEKMIVLRDAILNRTYEPLPSSRFEISDPKVREIFAADFPDRIVHHYVFDKTFPPHIEKHLHNDSCSCREGKGTLYAQKRLAHHILSVTENYKKSCILIKLDIKSYFTSINKKTLLDILLKHLDSQYPNGGEEYRTLKFLWKKIILDDPVPKMVVKGTPLTKSKVPPHKSLIYQPEGIGLVIGNLTSQGSSNAYLNEFDRYLHFELGLKHFVRYVDDLVIVLDYEGRQRIPEIINGANTFLRSQLGLELNPNKTIVRDMREGVEFLGVVVFSGHIVPGKRAVRNARIAFNKIAEGRKNPDDAVCILGHFEHINSRKILKRIFDEIGWDFGEKRRRSYQPKTGTIK